MAAIDVFPTYAGMTASGGLVDDGVYCTSNRTLDGDGGFGFWRYDAPSTTSANGGTILAKDGGGAGRFFRLLEGYTLASWFGIVPETTATTDQLAKCQALHAAVAAEQTPRHVIFGKGEIGLSAEWVVTAPMNIEGSGDLGGPVNSLPLTTGTSFKRIGATTSGAVVKFYNVNFGGFGIKSVIFDGNLTATKAFHMDACCGGLFEKVFCGGATSIAGHLTGTTATNSYHTFINCRFYKESDGGEALRLSGAPGEANACHITFTNTVVSHAGGSTGSSKGIVLGGCDNIRFFQTFCYAATENGRSIYVDWSEFGPNFPSNIGFFGLEAVGGIEIPLGGSTDFTPMQIFNWCLDNTFDNRRVILNSSSSIPTIINDRMSIEGRIGFSAHTSGGVQNVPSFAFTKLVYQEEEFDVGGYYNASNYRFTPPPAKYRISVRCESAGTMTPGNTFLVMLYKNGARLWDGEPGLCLFNNYGLSSGSWLVDANGSDYFEVFLIHSASGGTIAVNNTVSGAYFQAEQV